MWHRPANPRPTSPSRIGPCCALTRRLPRIGPHEKSAKVEEGSRGGIEPPLFYCAFSLCEKPQPLLSRTRSGKGKKQGGAQSLMANNGHDIIVIGTSSGG